MPNNQTIIALSTPPGSGAIALLRMSGPDSLELADKIGRLVNHKKISDQPSHTIHLGWAVNEHEERLDQVMFIVMRAPHTFTGEETVEISTHNNSFIIESIIQTAIHHGARLAQRGEFTRRAVENGKISLLQAEAINELICAQTEDALKKSLAQLEGSLSAWVVAIEQKLLTALSLSEASFEFLEEEHEFGTQIAELLQEIMDNIAVAKKNYDIRKQIREGIRIALIGTVNAGKSSLFNRLLGQERSIVTSIEGTTRDTVEATLHHQGVFWTMIDTAGLRQTADFIEQEGIRRSLQEAEKADLILLVIDQTKELTPENRQVHEQLLKDHEHKTIVVATKQDLPQTYPIKFAQYTLPVNALAGDGIPAVEKKIEERIQQIVSTAQAPFMVNQRHYHLLCSLEQRLAECRALLTQPTIHYELVSYQLRAMLEEMSELTGKTIGEKVLDTIFSEFCVGK